MLFEGDDNEKPIGATTTGDGAAPDWYGGGGRKEDDGPVASFIAGGITGVLAGVFPKAGGGEANIALEPGGGCVMKEAAGALLGAVTCDC